MKTIVRAVRGFLSILTLAVLSSIVPGAHVGASQDSDNDFLTTNAAREGVVTLESGLQYEILIRGEGARPQRDDTVLVNYQGTLVDGTVFDSSYKRHWPARLPLEKLIEGWRQALPLMSTGSKWRLYIPPELGYGARGHGAVGPNATLVYEVELLAIVGGSNGSAPPDAIVDRVADIGLSFKLDPRLTRGLYMGDRWVPPSHEGFIQVGDADGVGVAVRAVGLDASERPLAASPEWSAADPDMVTIEPARGGEVTVRVKREGQTRVEVTAGGASRVLSVSATRNRGVIQVEINAEEPVLGSENVRTSDGTADAFALYGQDE